MRKFTSFILLISILSTLLPFASVASATASSNRNIWDGTAATYIEEGDGTKDKPFIIKSAEELAYLAESVNNGMTFLNSYFELAGDIYLNDTSSDNWKSGANKWTTIGTAKQNYRNNTFEYKNVFEGHFNGKGHSIYGLYIVSSQDYQGLFGYVAECATVKNISIKDSYISGSNYVGGIAGYCEGTIFYCNNYANVIGSDTVGGIVGCGSVFQSTNLGQVEGGYGSVGGIVGSGDATYCFNYGNVDSDDCSEMDGAGGIVGTGSASKCHNAGTVTGNYNTGGICGYLGKYVTNCYNSGTVICGAAGGIVGKVDSNIYRGDTVSYCYNAGNIRDEKGKKQYPIIGWYDISTDNPVSGSFGVFSCYYLSNKTEYNSNGTMGLTSEQMKDPNNFVGFDFTKNWTMEGSKYYDYPELIFIKGYSETYGWCLANYKESIYGDSLNSIFVFNDNMYDINTECINDIYSHSTQALVDLYTLWAGNTGCCYGLSLLSLAEYYDLIDLSQYSNKDGEYLYDFGYEEIFVGENGKESFTLGDNQTLRNILLKAHFWQDRSEITDCEVFKNDYDFSQLLDYLNSPEAKPLLLTMAMGGMGGHAMVITTDKKPIDGGNGWFAIPVYDCNAPANSTELTNPEKYYTRGNSYLQVNINTSQYRYYAAEKIHENSYHVQQYNPLIKFWRDPDRLRYYDISQMSSEDFDFYFSGSGSHNNDYQLFFSGDSITITDFQGNTILNIENGKVEFIDENCSLNRVFGSEIETTGSWAFETNISEICISDTNSDILIISNDYNYLAKTTESSSLEFEINLGKVSGKFNGDETEQLIYIQDMNNENLVKVKSSGKSNDYIMIQNSEKELKITSDGVNYDYICANINEDDITTSDSDESDDDAEAFSGLIIIIVIGSAILILGILIISAIIIIKAKKRKKSKLNL